MDLIQKLAGGGHQVRALIYARDYDIQGNTNKGSELQTKAGELKDAAQALHEAADLLSKEPTLAELKSQAEKLKEAAKRDGSDGSLFKAAETLANHDGPDGLELKAGAVIFRFDKVKEAYVTLSDKDEYKDVIEGKSSLTPDKQQKVKAVYDAYNKVKNIYDQMLNLTKLAKATNELQAKAATKAQTLTEPASNLKNSVANLRDNSPGANAKKVESQFNEVKDTFNGLTSEKDKVQTQFQALNGAYNHILNVSKTTKLRVEAGASESEAGTLRALAHALHGAANALYEKASSGDVNVDEGAAENLKNAVGNLEATPGTLRKALQALGDHNEVTSSGQLPNLAKAVRDNYNIVKSKFEAVQKQKDKYTEGQGQAEYPLVVAAWNALNSKYNYVKFDKYFIDGGHEQRQYTDAPKYDVKDNSLGKRLSLKAEELEKAANKLHAKATNDPALTNLKTHAQALATEAGKLAKNEGGNASANADSVINEFNDLEGEYNQLLAADQAKVEKEFKTVEHIYDRILNVTKAGKLKLQAADMLSQAGTLYTKAQALATAGGLESQEDLRQLANDLVTAVGQESSPGLQQALNELKTADTSNFKDLITKAQVVINKYNAVVSTYEAVKDKKAQYTSASATSEYTQVESEFSNLKRAYNAGKCKAISPIYDKEY